jgi:hypothetical protein
VESEVESVPLEPGRQDVVRVMNLHKAKGLEAPVVFLADPLGGVKARADIRVVREGAQARGYFQMTRRRGDWGVTLLAEPEGWGAHEAAELEYVRAEETRLLYVAATRARDLLIVSRWAGSQTRQRPWAPFEPHLSAARELPRPGGVSPWSLACWPLVRSDRSPARPCERAGWRPGSRRWRRSAGSRTPSGPARRTTRGWSAARGRPPARWC